jgi:hypothetical protein
MQVESLAVSPFSSRQAYRRAAVEISVELNMLCSGKSFTSVHARIQRLPDRTTPPGSGRSFVKEHDPRWDDSRFEGNPSPDRELKTGESVTMSSNCGLCFCFFMAAGLSPASVLAS